MVKKANTKTDEVVDFSTDSGGLMVDLDQVEEVTYEAIPRGIYPCVIADCEFGMSQSSGNPMWTVVCEVSDGEYAGTKLWTYMVFAGKGLGITKRHLGRIIPELASSPFDPENLDIINQMLGLEINVKVGIRPYEGENRNTVLDLYAATGDDGFGL